VQTLCAKPNQINHQNPTCTKRAPTKKELHRSEALENKRCFLY
jgi:hypothetical protein